MIDSIEAKVEDWIKQGIETEKETETETETDIVLPPSLYWQVYIVSV